jgi:hypothetical protein
LLFITLGACLALVAVSWTPLWRVERATGRLAEMPPGSFWEFLRNLPGALANLSKPQTPGTILTMLPTLYLWENARTTLAVLTVGAVLGLMAWWMRPAGLKRSGPK